MSHTKGNWSIGKTHGCVISDTIPYDMKGSSTGHTEVEYYGGYLIGESIYRQADAKLIAAAPDMLEALQNLVKWHIHRGSDEKPLPIEKQTEEIIIALRAIKKATE